ncbi:MAG: ParB/RepB/Spo0J family partition protein [Alphaproteobacteria bacterium]|nr:ParB/RepB/Spo0J family partition protein [Alphaproteobacteria bacterium]
MSSKNLGRGLSAFLDIDESVIKNKGNTQAEIININISDIVANPFQPRHSFDRESLTALSESIKRKGVIQPILVIKLSDGKYQLIAGERRFRASEMAKLAQIPALVMDEMERKDQLEIAILENIQREDLNPIEEAEAYKRLMEEFSHTQEELSEILGKSRSHIANILRLLSLPNDVKDLIRNKKLSFGHARALIGAKNASELAKQIIDQSINVRETEQLIKSIKKDDYDYSNNFTEEMMPKRKNYIDPEAQNIAQQISLMLGLQVNIKLKNKGGVIEIGFKNFNELDHLLSQLNNNS